MLDSVLASEAAAKRAEYVRKVTPLWIGMTAPVLVGVVLAGANPYGSTTINWGLAIAIWGVCAFWVAVLARDWRRAKEAWRVR